MCRLRGPAPQTTAGNTRAARWVHAEIWHPQQQDMLADDGSLTRRLPYRRSEELVMDILRHGPDVEVLLPVELRTAVIERLRQSLATYEPPMTTTAPLPDSGQRMKSGFSR